MKTDYTKETKVSKELNEVLLPIIDAAHQKHNAAQPQRGYLGASLWGEKCQRKLAYVWHKTPKDEDRAFKGTTLRIFDMGHDGEARAAEYLRRAGFDLRTHDEDGKQYGFSEADGRLGGHIDGVIVDGPALPGLTYPCIWEHKQVGLKSFKEFVENGLEQANPKYYSQCNTYMWKFELPFTLFQMTCKDTGEQRFEVIPFDARNAQESSDRAVAVIKTATPEEAPRMGGASENYYECKYMCDYRNRCHNIDPDYGKPAKVDWSKLPYKKK